MSELTKEYFEKHLDERFEELARAVAHGFHDVDKSLNNLEKRQVVLEKGHENLKVEMREGFKELKSAMKKTEQTVQKLQVGQDRLHDLHKKDDREITMLRGYYHRLDERVSKLEGAQA